MKSKKLLAFSTVTGLIALGGGMAVYGAACSPAVVVQNEAGVCDPDSGTNCPCDTNTYKTSDCYTGPAGTNGKGICQLGKRSCVGGKLTACEGEVTPQPEVCNLADDDCNNIVDDVPEVLDASPIAYCTSPACDQAGMTDAAIYCWGTDPGICGAGTKTCAPGPKGGTPTGCKSFIKAGAPEVCNGIDDDCNGQVDDGLYNLGDCEAVNQLWGDASPFLDGGPVKVFGECQHGQYACDIGKQKCVPSQPGMEVQNYGYGCDGLDNDCDGVIDNRACSDTYDTTYGYIYCCNESNVYFSCEPLSNIDASYWSSCKLAN